MHEDLNRRHAVKAVAAAGSLLLLGGPAPADEPDDRDALTGEWFNGGKLDQPCAVFQQGRVLLLINENGDIASGQMTGANEVTVLKGWEGGLVGRVAERGRVIAWKGGGSWRRR
ncbi:MAG TPA: twin-arginine translocation signal domain-containing protein [Gemmataceae bacterium]|nr:twin-arginine translocation signal domain-containing protein [Gemmataceae bacterium]